MQFDAEARTLYFTVIAPPSKADVEEWGAALGKLADDVPVERVVVMFLMGGDMAAPHLARCAELGVECRTFVEGTETVLAPG
ncbi:MAG: hypothetical protein R3B99_00125 [Polyangiales bacterium]|nr:hypothetical protein [Myxococcales bacterium]MCB9599443.1 hypothetical protein [Sandaracinus sp.]